MAISGMIDVADYGDLQTALNQLGEFGGTVWAPKATYAIDRPVLVQGHAPRLLGSSGRYGGAKIQQTRYYGPGVYIMRQRNSRVALGPSLLPGPGHSLELTDPAPPSGVPGYKGYLNLRDCDLCDVDGLTTFTAELVFRPGNLSRYGGILSSWGRRGWSDQPTSAFYLHQNFNAQASCGLATSDGWHQFGSWPGFLQEGQPVHLALTYDGSAIRLFGGPVGGTCDLLAPPQPASGPVRMAVEEDMVLGHVPFWWPEDGVVYDQAYGWVDAVRLSRTCRYTQPFSAWSQKPTVNLYPGPGDPANILLLNFDQFLAGGGQHSPDNGYMVVGTTGQYSQPVYLAWRDVTLGPSAAGGCLEGFEISCLGPAVLALFANEFEFRDLFCHNCSVGLQLLHQSFICDIDRVELAGWGEAAPSGRKAVRAGILCGRTSSAWAIRRAKAYGFPYSLRDVGANGKIDHFFVTTEKETVSHLSAVGDHGGSNILNVDNFLIDDEPGAPTAALRSAFHLDRMDLVDVRGGKVEVMTNPNRIPAVEILGGGLHSFATAFRFGGNVTQVFLPAAAAGGMPGLRWDGSVQTNVRVPWVLQGV